MKAITALLSLLLCACAASRVESPLSDDIAVPGGSIHVDSAGAGATVLLIHGGFGDRRMWDAQLPALAARYRVVRMELRGFGGSPAPAAPYVASADVAAVLDRFGAARAHVVGNSMGGALAIDFALAYPARVASLTVVSSGPGGFPATADRARFAADIDSVRAVFSAAATEGTERGVALWEAHPMVAVAHANPRTAPLLHRMIEDNRGLFALEYWPDDLRDAIDRLPEIHAPTLIVVGDRDIALVRAGAEYAAARIAGARLVVIPDADHLPQMEHPRMFNRVLLDFLEQSAE